jgi:hypothetical protein
MRRAALALLATCLAFPCASAGAADTACPPLQRMMSVDMEVLPHDGRLAIPVTLKDRPSKLLLDTGGATRALVGKVAVDLGLHLIDSNVSLLNIAGKRSEQGVDMPSMTMGGVTFKKIHFPIMPGTLPADGNIDKRSYDGLFALDLFRDTDIDIDFGAAKMTLFSVKHCPGKVVYWPTTVVAVIPFEFDSSSHIRFPVTLDGSGLSAIMDSGAYSSTLDLAIAKGRYDVDVNAPDVEKAGELAPGRTIYRHRFKTLTLEGITIANPMMRLMPNMLPEEQVTGTRVIRDHGGTLPPVIIGMNILSKLHVYIAMKEHKLYITPAAAPPAKEEAARTP